jgi:asparagine synthase (glutamine-hydrolysing)
MCGLFASLAFSPDPRRIDLVAHRGPDGSGWRVFDSPAGPVVFGHRRLAIIDLRDEGLQPMTEASGRYSLIFNGEIYNYVELRDELRAAGYVFLTETDSEVVLCAYRAWSESCLDRFLGMFAFLIWDDREKRLFTARDRFGIKPLYLVANSCGLAFGSEIKQLLDLPGLPTRVNIARARDFLISGVSDHTSETLFEGVYQLQPGCCATVDAAQPWRGELRQRRWYARPAHGTLKLTESDAADQFRQLLTDAVRLHLRSDVSVGSCLSGGLDSSALVCLMSGMPGGGGRTNDFKTVSACYDETSVDERPFMKAVVSQTGVDARYVFPKPEDVFARASDITWHQDEPFGSTSVFAQWCVFQEARRSGIKVMLDGQGADEQLAGYHGSFPYYMAHLFKRLQLLAFIRTAIERKESHGASFLQQVRPALGLALPESMLALLRNKRRQGATDQWTCSPAFDSLDDDRSALQIASQANGLPPVTDIASLCVVLTFAANLQLLLHWEDRNSMAHSIEARVPFLDHRLVEFSLALGSDHKIVGADTKRVLRRAMTGILPEKVVTRRDKLGFATPEQEWFRGPLRRQIEDAIETTLRRFPDLLNADGVRRLASDMLEGRQAVDFRLWRIANMGLWGERFGVSL